jgi:hypothetical protein
VESYPRAIALDVLKGVVSGNADGAPLIDHAVLEALTAPLTPVRVSSIELRYLLTGFMTKRILAALMIHRKHCRLLRESESELGF